MIVWTDCSLLPRPACHMDRAGSAEHVRYQQHLHIPRLFDTSSIYKPDSLSAPGACTNLVSQLFIQIIKCIHTLHSLGEHVELASELKSETQFSPSEIELIYCDEPPWGWSFDTGKLKSVGGVAKTEVSDDLRIGWPQQRLKDMTSMSGLRQGFPKENGLTAVV